MLRMKETQTNTSKNTFLLCCSRYNKGWLSLSIFTKLIALSPKVPLNRHPQALGLGFPLGLVHTHTHFVHVPFVYKHMAHVHYVHGPYFSIPSLNASHVKYGLEMGGIAHRLRSLP